MPEYVQFVFVLYHLLLGYVTIGALFAVPFVTFGVNAVDSEAKESGAGFRFMILPGVVAFWPMLALRWIKHEQPPVERNAHRCSAR